MITFLKYCRARKSEDGVTVNAGEGFTAKQNARRLMIEVLLMHLEFGE